jgi:hypothetical protein
VAQNGCQPLVGGSRWRSPDHRSHDIACA